MTIQVSFNEYAARLSEFIYRFGPGTAVPCISCAKSPPPDFNQLALILFQLQWSFNPAYRKFCEARHNSRETIRHWSEIPAVPASAFKSLELSSLPPPERAAVFYSSGTTIQQPSRHFHNRESLAVYERSLLPWFQAHLLADVVASSGPVTSPANSVPPSALGLIGNDSSGDEGLVPPPWTRTGALPRVSAMRLLCLTPPPDRAPHSSLVHMLETVLREFGSPDSRFIGQVAAGAWGLDFDEALSALDQAVTDHRPLALFGAAFSFVHLLDHLAEGSSRYHLPAGSRVMETGGYKGRSRALSKANLYLQITDRLGIAPEFIVCEYGMSELSSQAYDHVAGSPAPPHPAPRVLHFPPWARARILSPETGQEVPEGETGLIRVYDLANVRSVLALQTDDLAIRRGSGFELVGRVAGAEARGCSLMAL